MAVEFVPFDIDLDYLDKILGKLDMKLTELLSGIKGSGNITLTDLNTTLKDELTRLSKLKAYNASTGAWDDVPIEAFNNLKNNLNVAFTDFALAPNSGLATKGLAILGSDGSNMQFLKVDTEGRLQTIGEMLADYLLQKSLDNATVDTTEVVGSALDVRGMGRKVIYISNSVPPWSPVIVRSPANIVYVTSIEDLWHMIDAPVVIEGGSEVKYVRGWKIVDNRERWTEIRKIIRHKYSGKILRFISPRGIIDVTPNHSIYTKAKPNGKPVLRLACDVKVGEYLDIPEIGGSLAQPRNDEVLWIGTEELAWLYGFFTGDGGINHNSHSNQYKVEFYSKDEELLKRVAAVFELNFHHHYNIVTPPSDNGVSTMYVISKGLYKHFSQFYTRQGFKQIPPFILNAPTRIKLAFLRGLYEADGSKAWGFFDKGLMISTNSQALAMGIIWLAKSIFPTTDHHVSVLTNNTYLVTITKGLGIGKSEIPLKERQRLYEEAMRLRAEYGWGAKRIAKELGLSVATVSGWLYRGQKPRRRIEETDRITEIREMQFSGYVYDIETKTHSFFTGIGPVKAHNTQDVDVTVYIDVSPDGSEWYEIRSITVPASSKKIGVMKDPHAYIRARAVASASPTTGGVTVAVFSMF